VISTLKDACELAKMGNDLLDKHFLTETEKELLQLAAQSGEFHILNSDQLACPIVRVGGQEMGGENDPVSLAKYFGAFKNLCANGYIEHAGGQLFRLTSSGFNRK